MALYLISYDLLKPGKNYDPLIDALTQQGAKRVLVSQWTLNTYCSPKQIRDWARRYMETMIGYSTSLSLHLGKAHRLNQKAVAG